MRLLRRCQILAASTFVSFSTGVLAQQGAQPQLLPMAVQPAASPSCVLHVWPSATAKSSYSGWFHGGAVDGDRRGIKGYPALHGEVLNTAAQKQLLDALDWATLIERPASGIVIHDGPPEPDDDLGRVTPLIADRPECYEELIIHSVFVERAAFSATTVRVMVIAKTWQGGGTAPKTYSWMANDRADFGAGDEATVERALKAAFSNSIRRVLDSSYMHRH